MDDNLIIGLERADDGGDNPIYSKTFNRLAN